VVRVSPRAQKPERKKNDRMDSDDSEEDDQVRRNSTPGRSADTEAVSGLTEK